MSLFSAVVGDLFSDWIKLPFVERATVLILLVEPAVLWMFETVRYTYKRLSPDSDEICLAPITVRGPLLESLGHGGVATALKAELFSVRDSLDRVLGTRPAPYLAPAIGADSGYYLVGLREEGAIPIELEEREAPQVEQAMTLKVGSLSIPVSEILDLCLALITALPVPWRRRYVRSLIEVSLLQGGDQIRLTVSRAASPAAIFTQTVPASTLDDLSQVIRDAAFMILEIHGSFKGRQWRGMRRLFDGLKALDEFRRTGSTAARDRARQYMRDAAQSDPENLEALYYHGAMTMVDRTDGTIEEAIRCFERVLESLNSLDDAKARRQDSSRSADLGKLRSVVHTGLAYCFAQQWHRLGNRKGDVLDRAKWHTDSAEKEWAKLRHASKNHLKDHPLIPFTKAMVTAVEEEAPDRVDKFTRAYLLYRDAVYLQPDNGMFYNNTGWVLLKLAEWGVKEVPKSPHSDPTEPSDVALLAEQFLQQSLGLNPSNKLTHANLCLLYSLPAFHDAEKTGLARARYHGKKALALDPEYVNGHRDLAVAFIRYGELDKAYKSFTKALEIADLPEKDIEIIHDVVHELSKRGNVPASEMKRWRQPDSRLLEPAAKAQQANA